VSNETARNETDDHRAPEGVKYYKKDFWAEENLKYAKPHFRMRKVARVVSEQARGRQCSLLDVGCGPGALGSLMPSNVKYHGIDISIPEPAQNLLEVDILEDPIGFRGMKFDLVVAQGLFEYLGEHQSQKFAEITEVLKDNGKFIVTYMNFDHRRQEIYWPYSNVQPAADFRRDLGRYFKIERWFAGAHNWNHTVPRRRLLMLAQDRLNVYVPLVSPRLAVDFCYICSPLR
jgi:cyclopropane fatty-acyl-phospholipid synthase-like methyltransferase